MANYTIAAGEIAVHDKVLTANVADIITFTDPVNAIEVLSDGSSAIYVCVEPGYTVTVSGPHSRKIPAGGSSSIRIDISPITGSIITLISSGTPTYSVAAD